MTVNIDKMRADIAAENRRFVLQIITTIAGTATATVAIMTLLLHLAGKL